MRPTVKTKLHIRSAGPRRDDVEVRTSSGQIVTLIEGQTVNFGLLLCK